MNGTGFSEPDFRRLGATSSEPAAINCLQHKVDQLIALLNGFPVAKTVVSQRSRFHGREKISKFLQDRGDYVHGGPGCWHVYNWGGRWEPQFNVGMFGLPGKGYLRAGLAFNLTRASTDPDRDVGAATVRSLFVVLRSLARTALKNELTTLLSRPRSIVEHGDDVPDLRLATGAQAVSWLTSLKYPDLERWVFFGRRLQYEAPDDRYARVGQVARNECADVTELLFRCPMTLNVVACQ